MAKTKKYRPKFGGNSLIEQVIAAPLEAAAKANSNMAKAQLSFLLEYCFKKEVIVDAENGDTNKYIPEMVNMTLTRQEVIEGDDGEIEIIDLESTLNIPIMTLVPLSSLAIEKMELDFELEVTSMETTSSDTQTSTDQKSSNEKNSGGVALRGKIGASKTTKANSNRKDTSRASLDIKITAGPLPLPSGVLSIIDSFTKNIAPVDVRTSSKTLSSETSSPQKNERSEDT